MEITKVLPMLTTAAGWSPLAGVGERLSGERGVEWSMVPTRGYPPPCSTAPPSMCRTAQHMFGTHLSLLEKNLH